VGIVTSHQLKYCEDPQTKMADIMIKSPVSAPKGTTIQEAYQIMIRHRITILPVVDEARVLQGMYCFKDVRDILRNQNPIYKSRLEAPAAVRRGRGRQRPSARRSAGRSRRWT